MDVSHVEEGIGGGGLSQQTLVALFDDPIDTEDALVGLRKAGRPAPLISLAVRDRSTSGAGASAGLLSSALAAASLDGVGDWLQGLTSVVIPQRGTFIVAGPLGAVLMGSDEEVQAAGGLSAASLRHIFVEFGFAEDEAGYLEHRVIAGAPLVAFTAADPSHLQAARQLFASHNAVHIGVARTDDRVARGAASLLAAPPEASTQDGVLVTDAVAPLRRLCASGVASPVSAACGARVIDRNGEDVGTVEELLADSLPTEAPDSERLQVRYVVIAFGGLLGIGRHRIAMPVGLANLDMVPVQASVGRPAIHEAPPYDPDEPFSRREEAAVFRYFGIEPYWLRGVAPSRRPDDAGGEDATAS